MNCLNSMISTNVVDDLELAGDSLDHRMLGIDDADAIAHVVAAARVQKLLPAQRNCCVAARPGWRITIGRISSRARAPVASQGRNEFQACLQLDHKPEILKRGAT